MVNPAGLRKKYKKTLDKTDVQMIALLKDNGRMANTELARHLGIAESTVRKRLKRLMDDGTIKVVAVGNIPMLLGGITGNINILVAS